MNSSLFSRGVALVAAGLMVLAAFGAVQDLSLKRRPKVGDVSEFKLSATFETEQGGIVFSQLRQEKITEVNPTGGYVMQSTTSETKITMGGQDLPGQDALEKVVFGPDGLVASYSSDKPGDPLAYRMAHLHDFKAPDGAVKVGDEIKFEIAADPKLETPAVKSDYTVVGVEKVGDWDAVKLTFTSAESGAEMNASISGTVWISTEDGALLKSDEVWKNVQPTGTPFPLSGKFGFIRVK